MVIKAVFFDVDGTLYSKDFKIVEDYFKKFSEDYDLNYSNIKEIFKQSYDEVKKTERIFDSVASFWNEVNKKGLIKLGLNTKLVPVLKKYYDLSFEKMYVKSIKPAKGLIEFLEYLKAKNVKMFTLSGTTNNYKKYKLIFDKVFVKKKKNLKIKQLKNLGIFEYFSQIFLSEEFQTLKPEISVFLKVVKKVGFKPEETLMIGDSKHDLAGKKIGMKTVLIKTRKSFSKNKELKPDLIINNYVDKRLKKFFYS